MNNPILHPNLRLVAWELTRACNLSCSHCRANAERDYKDELTTEECLRIVNEIAAISNPVLILTGGEPLLRKDLNDIAKYAISLGLKVVMGTNGTLIDTKIASSLAAIPISRLGISIDFPTAEEQDRFRGKVGAFKATMEGIDAAIQAGISIQINSTISKLNKHYLDELLKLSIDVGATAFHPFMLVPTGRGKGLKEVEMTPSEYEETLLWIYRKSEELKGIITFKPTDAPQYMRICMQNRECNVTAETAEPGNNRLAQMTRGCLAGTGFCFISHTGNVQGCGYLDVKAGNLRNESFSNIWHSSPLFEGLRNLNNLSGKCGYCDYKIICGGCRARAYEATGNHFAAEPLCLYEPLPLK